MALKGVMRRPVVARAVLSVSERAELPHQGLKNGQIAEDVSVSEETDPERRDPRSRPAHWDIVMLVTGLALAIASGIVSHRIGGPYGDGLQEDRRVRRVFNEGTGALELLTYDLDGDLRFDTWSYMDGDRAIRTEYDVDRDGRVDRRE